jgi:hypothetical protein
MQALHTLLPFQRFQFELDGVLTTKTSLYVLDKLGCEVDTI